MGWGEAVNTKKQFRKQSKNLKGYTKRNIYLTSRRQSRRNRRKKKRHKTYKKKQTAKWEM